MLGQKDPVTNLCIQLDTREKDVNIGLPSPGKGLDRLDPCLLVPFVLSLSKQAKAPSVPKAIAIAAGQLLGQRTHPSDPFRETRWRLVLLGRLVWPTAWLWEVLLRLGMDGTYGFRQDA